MRHLCRKPSFLLKGRCPTACGYWVDPTWTTKDVTKITCKLCIRRVEKESLVKFKKEEKRLMSGKRGVTNTGLDCLKAEIVKKAEERIHEATTYLSVLGLMKDGGDEFAKSFHRFFMALDGSVDENMFASVIDECDWQS